MNDKVRVNIIIGNEKIECYYSNELSLSENTKLLSKLININLEDKIFVTYLSNKILDPHCKMKNYHFIDGQILYLY